MKSFVKHMVVLAAGFCLVAGASAALAASTGQTIKVIVVADTSIKTIGALGFSVHQKGKKPASHGGLGRKYTSASTMPSGASYSFGYKTGMLGSGKDMACNAKPIKLEKSSIVKLSLNAGKCVATVIPIK
jgi:hypothetical protein